MQAYVLTSFDTPPEHREVADPTPGPGEVRVRVLATSVNPVDTLVRRGFFRIANDYRFPAVYGRDLAGVVESVGPGATRYAVGDEVFGFVKRPYIGDGTFAELVVVPEDQFIAPRPRTLTMTQAGTLGLAGITALECVDAASGPGENVILVNGAAGGLGTFAVQLARARGAQVLAAVRSPDGAEHARAMGAHLVLDARDGDVVAQVRAAVPDGVTGLVDFVKRADPPIMGEDETDAQREFARLAHGVLRPGGRAASVTNGGVPSLMGDLTYLNVHSTPSPHSLARFAALVDDGLVTSVVDEVYPFSGIDRAFERLGRGGVRGKLAVSLADSAAGSPTDSAVGSSTD